jgi:hypothetical protein
MRTARHQAILTALKTNDADTVITALEDHGHLHYLGLETGLATSD